MDYRDYHCGTDLGLIVPIPTNLSMLMRFTASASRNRQCELELYISVRSSVLCRGIDEPIYTTMSQIDFKIDLVVHIGTSELIPTVRLGS